METFKIPINPNGLTVHPDDLGCGTDIIDRHIAWLTRRGFLSHRTLMAVFDPPGHLEIPHITDDGREFLVELRKSNFRKYLDGMPSTTCWVALRHIADLWLLLSVVGGAGYVLFQFIRRFF